MMPHSYMPALLSQRHRPDTDRVLNQKTDGYHLSVMVEAFVQHSDTLNFVGLVHCTDPHDIQFG